MDEMFSRAVQLDRRGDWVDSLAVFERIAERLNGQQEGSPRWPGIFGPTPPTAVRAHASILVHRRTCPAHTVVESGRSPWLRRLIPV